jgi:GH24 family phage-related lysozyme (muramidase)
MKGLFLLLIFSPVVLFGQMGQKAVIDSIKASFTNLQKVSVLTNNYRGAWVENILASDSGEYVTVVTRIRVTDVSVIPALPFTPVREIKMKEMVAGKMSALTVPPLPPLIIKAETITALPLRSVFKITIGDIPFAKIDTLTAPPLPNIKVEIEALPIPAIKLNIGDIPFVKTDTVTVPPLPDVIAEAEALPLVSIVRVRVEGAVVKVDTLTVPALPDFTDEIDALPLFDPVKLPVQQLPAAEMAPVIVPAFEEKRMPVTDMHLSEEGYGLLEKLEGFSPELYSLGDGGFTIGFGFFVPYEEINKWRRGMTWDDAERTIRQKVPIYEDQVKRYVNVPLTQEEFDAMTMLAYNLGGFSKATSIVNDINGDADFDKLRRDWMRFVHSKAPGVMKGLVNRRKDELKVRNEWDYQPERIIQIFKNGK